MPEINVKTIGHGLVPVAGMLPAFLGHAFPMPCDGGRETCEVAPWESWKASLKESSSLYLFNAFHFLRSTTHRGQPGIGSQVFLLTKSMFFSLNHDVSVERHAGLCM